MATPDQNNTEEIIPNTPVKPAQKKTDIKLDEAAIEIAAASDKMTRVISVALALIFLYASVIWQNLPLDDDGKGYNIRWWITGGVALALVAGFFVWRRKKSKMMETTGNFLLLMFIVLGAAIFSIYISGSEQSLWFKLFAIAYFSFLPAWLYLDFISKKGRTLWEEFVMNLYRLKIDNITNLPKPPLNSLYYDRWKKYAQDGTKEKEYKTIYQKKFEGLFGVIPADEKQSEGKNTFSVFSGENLWPVAIVTLLISFGWVLVTEPEPIFGRSAFPKFDMNGRPDLPYDTLRFGFLGAYFYILQMLVRRYFQNDLKTSAYISCILRIIVVILLVWVLGKVMGDTISREQQFGLAFFIGIFPMVGLQAIQALIKLPLQSLLPSLKQKFPLNELDGLNIWYESRLLEEGIEDMQNLATANLVDVMLNTRIPVERLVDWVDQSILYLHLNDGDDKRATDDREVIRRYGIRTATDLEDAFNGWQKIRLNTGANDAVASEAKLAEEEAENKEFVKKLERILNHKVEGDGTDDDGPSKLRSILATFKKEPNLDHVRCWRSFTVTELELQKAEPWDNDMEAPGRMTNRSASANFAG